MYKCKKGEKQYKMCKEANADYCSDCPHGVKENNIEEDIKILEEKMNKELDFLIENANKTEQLTAISIMTMKQPMIVLFLSILSDYKRVLKENDCLKNHVHYKKCIACGKEFRSKRSDAKYCTNCSKSVSNKNYFAHLTEEQKEKRREKVKLAMRKMRKARGNR